MKKIGTYIWGVALIAVGVILALNALNITNIDLFFDGWWTLLIIVPSVVGLITNSEKGGSFISLVIGVILFLCARDILSIELLFKLAFPIILVVIGISVLINAFSGRKQKTEGEYISPDNTKNEKCEEYFATFSSQDLKYNGEMFNGVKLNAIFGGVKCDLRGADIADGSVITCSAVFGGIDVIIPEGVCVKIKSTSLFGGVSNKKSASAPAEKTVYLNATCLFGGVDVK